MNREVKIRVWDTVAGVWLPQDDIGIDNLGNVYLFTEDTGELDEAGNFIWKCTLLKHSDRYKVMQFTGLTDKNDTPLYEGDIVELHSWKPNVKETKRQVIEWIGSGLFMRRTDGTVSGHAELPHKRLEVIGNVVDNPELLQEAA